MSLPDPIILARQLRPPGSLTEFGARFRTEADCEAFLFQVRYPDGFVCPRCGSSRGWPLRGSRLTAGTVLHGTRKDLKSWFLAVFFMVTLTPGVSAVQLQRQLGIKRYETTFQMMHKIRSALVVPGCEVLHGEVEVDDTFIGGKDADHDGRGGDKVLVVGAVELTPFSEVPSGKLRRRSGRLRLKVVPDASAHSLAGFVEREVEPGATVYTDGWDGYRSLSRCGFHHQRIVQGKGREATPILPHIHRVFSNLKAWLHGTHHGRIEPQYLQAYLNEYIFRFNRRFWRGPAFLRALTLMVRPKHKM